MANKYPRNFITLIKDHCSTHEKPLLRYVNTYHKDKTWNDLPNGSKMRYFHWVIEQGKKNKRAVSKKEASEKLRSLYYINFNIYTDVRKITDINLMVYTYFYNIKMI